MTEEYEENATKKIAERVSGFDAIFFGHDHAERAETINGVPCLNPSCNANKVAVATITLIADPPRLTPDGRVPSPTKGLKWRIADRSGEIVDISDLPVDEDYMKHFQPTIDSVNAYVNREIGVCPVSLHTRDCFFGPAAFTDYIHGSGCTKLQPTYPKTGRQSNKGFHTGNFNNSCDSICGMVFLPA